MEFSSIFFRHSTMAFRCISDKFKVKLKNSSKRENDTKKL